MAYWLMGYPVNMYECSSGHTKRERSNWYDCDVTIGSEGYCGGKHWEDTSYTIKGVKQDCQCAYHGDPDSMVNGFCNGDHDIRVPQGHYYKIPGCKCCTRVIKCGKRMKKV